MNTSMSPLNRAIKTGILALGLFSAAQVQAIVPPEIPLPVIDDVFVQADVNGDNQISVDEFYQLHYAASLLEFEITFKAMDADQSGDVSGEEFINFLPAEDVSLFKEQFINAAGDDELLDVKEFSMMRLKARGTNPDLLWQFALLDRDHDGQLSPQEYYGLPLIEPPVEPPIVIVDPVEPADPEPPVKPELPEEEEKPQEEAEETAEKDNSDKENNDFVGPVKPEAEDDDIIAELEEKLSNTQHKIERVEMSVKRTLEKMEAATNDKILARLERRLERQTNRIERLTQTYKELMAKLEEAQKAMYG